MNNSKYYFFTFLFLFLISRFNFSITEYSITEISQALIILISIIITLINKNIIIKKSKLIFYLKLFFFSFLFYEEISFLTEGIFEVNDFFLSSEFSIRHLNFFSLFPDDINIVPYKSNYFTQHLLQTIGLIFLGYGSYLPKLKKYNFIFLDKVFSKASLFVLINLIFGYFITFIFNLEKSFIPIHFEFIELFIYMIFLFDLVYKIKKLSPKS